MELPECESGLFSSSSFFSLLFTSTYNLRCLKQCSGPSRPLLALSRPLQALTAFTRSTYYQQNYCFFAHNCFQLSYFVPIFGAFFFFLHFAYWFESRIRMGIRLRIRIWIKNDNYRYPGTYPDPQKIRIRNTAFCSMFCYHRVNGNNNFCDNILSCRRRRGRGYLRNRRQVTHWRYSGYPLTLQVSWSKKIACSIIYQCFCFCELWALL